VRTPLSIPCQYQCRPRRGGRIVSISPSVPTQGIYIVSLWSIVLGYVSISYHQYLGLRRVAGGGSNVAIFHCFLLQIAIFPCGVPPLAGSIPNCGVASIGWSLVPYRGGSPPTGLSIVISISISISLCCSLRYRSLSLSFRRPGIVSLSTSPAKAHKRHIVITTSIT